MAHRQRPPLGTEPGGVCSRSSLSTGAAFDLLGPQLEPGAPSGSMWDSEPVLPLTLANGALRSKQATWENQGHLGHPAPNSPGWSGPQWEGKGPPALSYREGPPPLNVGGILRHLPGWGLVREARLWPWGSGQSAPGPSGSRPPRPWPSAQTQVPLFPAVHPPEWGSVRCPH